MIQETNENYLALIKQATVIFQECYPGSILFTAVGKPASGLARSANDLTNWVFRAQTTHNGTAALEYSNGKFGAPSIIGQWMGLEYKPLPQGKHIMSEAIAVLNNHCKESLHGFSQVGLGTPAAFNPPPMFWFCVESNTQGVSASTLEFFPNLFPCAPSGTVGELKE